MTPKLLWVEWLDSTSRSGWSGPLVWVGVNPPIRTVGWLVYENEEILVISPSHQPEENLDGANFLGCHSIPQGAIVAWGEITGVWS